MTNKDEVKRGDELQYDPHIFFTFLEKEMSGGDEKSTLLYEYAVDKDSSLFDHFFGITTRVAQSGLYKSVYDGMTINSVVMSDLLGYCLLGFAAGSSKQLLFVVTKHKETDLLSGLSSLTTKDNLTDPVCKLSLAISQLRSYDMFFLNIIYLSIL